MQAHEVEARRAGLREVRAVEVAVGGREARHRVDVVIAKAAHVERLAVQVQLLAAHLEFPDAEALAPRLDDLPVLHEVHARRVEVGMFRRPGTEVRKRNFQGEV